MIISYVLIEVLYILEDLVTKSASDGLGLLNCSYVLLESISILKVLVTESASDSNNVCFRSVEGKFSHN